MKRYRGKLVVGLVLLSVLAAAGVWAFDRAPTGRETPGVIAASGRLELQEVRPSSTTGGRLVRLPVREGQPVHRGDTIAVLDQRTLETGLAAARSAAAAAREAVNAAGRGADALETQLRQAAREADRLRRLLERDAVARQAAEQAESAVERLENELRSARAAERLARERASAESARVRAAELQLDEAVVLAPVDGIVAEVLTRQGEVAAPGYPIVSLRETGHVRLRVYIPLVSVERVRVGAAARVFVDGFPDRVFGGEVESIASEAEFTPRDIHMPDERVTLVYDVVIGVDDPSGVLKDGFPADAEIRWDPAAPWPGPETQPW